MDEREVGAVFSKIVIAPVRNRIAPITAAGGTCRGALRTVFSPRATVPTVLRRLGECDGAHQVVGERIPQRQRFYLVEPRTKNWVSPRPRAMALTHSAVAGRCL